MLPDRRPAHRSGPAFNDHGRKRNAIATSRNAVAQLVVVGQAIHQRLEPANLGEPLAAHGHHRAQGKINRLEAPGLQHLAPEIRIDGDDLPPHRQRGRVCEAVEAVHQSRLRLLQRGDHLRQAIRRHAHIGVADDHDGVLRLARQLHQLGDLRIGAERWAAHDELRVAAGKLLHELANNLASPVFRLGHAQQNLNRPGVLLGEPASQAVFRGRIAALERFEQGDSRLRVEGCELRVALVERETTRHEPLPKRQGKAQQGQAAENQVQNHRRVIIMVRSPHRKRVASGKKRLDCRRRRDDGCAGISQPTCANGLRVEH